MIFNIANELMVLSEVWLVEHDKRCPFSKKNQEGAIGGRLTYKFTPTRLGLVIKMACACGEETDLTDYKEW